MTGACVEGLLTTDRLTAYHLRTSQGKAPRPRLLFLGGSNFDLRLKRSFLDTPLVRRFDVATYEPRGIGRTEQPDGNWSMEDYALDAMSVMDALGWDRAHILGESFGGMAALHLAHKAPGRVSRMVIASATAGGPDHRSFDISQFLGMPREDAASAALCLQDTRNRDMRDSDPEAFARLLADRIRLETAFATPSVTSGGYARLLDARRLHDCTQGLDQIETPIAVIAGVFDQQARPEAQRALSDSLPNASFHSFDAGHGVLFAAPGAMQVTLDFLLEETPQDTEKSGEFTT